MICLKRESWIFLYLLYVLYNLPPVKRKSTPELWTEIWVSIQNGLAKKQDGGVSGNLHITVSYWSIYCWKLEFFFVCVFLQCTSPRVQSTRTLSSFGGQSTFSLEYFGEMYRNYWSNITRVALIQLFFFTSDTNT